MNEYVDTNEIDKGRVKGLTKLICNKLGLTYLPWFDDIIDNFDGDAVYRKLLDRQAGKTTFAAILSIILSGVYNINTYYVVENKQEQKTFFNMAKDMLNNLEGLNIISTDEYLTVIMYKDIVGQVETITSLNSNTHTPHIININKGTIYISSTPNAVLGVMKTPYCWIHEINGDRLDCLVHIDNVNETDNNEIQGLGEIFRELHNQVLQDADLWSNLVD